MKQLSGLSVFYVKIISSVLFKVDALKAEQLSACWFPKQALREEEYKVRWQMIHEAAAEVGFEEIEKVLRKIDRTYAKKTGRKVLSNQMIYEIVAEVLEKSASDTKLFNQFI